MTTKEEEKDAWRTRETLSEIRMKVRNAYNEDDWRLKVDGMSDLQVYSMHAYLKRNERI